MYGVERRLLEMKGKKKRGGDVKKIVFKVLQCVKLKKNE